jgi:hypothetical protein
VRLTAAFTRQARGLARHPTPVDDPQGRLADHHAVEDRHDPLVIVVAVRRPVVDVPLGVLDALLQEPAGHVGPVSPGQELLGELGRR